MPAAVYADLTALAVAQGSAGQNMMAVAGAVIHNAASAIQAEAVTLAPVKTGKLKGSIQIRVIDALTVSIGPSVFYGVFQEFGTGTRGEFKKNAYIIKPVKGKYLVFQINGKTIRTKEVHHPGIPAHPFMRPAAEKVLNTIAPDLAQQGALMVTRGPNAA